MQSLGATETINYKKTPDWGKKVQEITGGVDHVVEVGGAGTLNESLKAVSYGGQISLIGVLTGGKGEISTRSHFDEKRAISGHLCRL